MSNQEEFTDDFTDVGYIVFALLLLYAVGYIIY